MLALEASNMIYEGVRHSDDWLQFALCKYLRRAWITFAQMRQFCAQLSRMSWQCFALMSPLFLLH